MGGFAELHAGVGGGLIAVTLPGAQLRRERGAIGDAPGQAAVIARAQFDFRDGHPSPVIGREVKLEACFDPRRLRWRERFVERSRVVGVNEALADCRT